MKTRPNLIINKYNYFRVLLTHLHQDTSSTYLLQGKAFSQYFIKVTPGHYHSLILSWTEPPHFKSLKHLYPRSSNAGKAAKK